MQTVATGGATEARDSIEPDHDIMRNPKEKRRRLVERFAAACDAPIAARPPGPCVTGNPLFDAVSLFDPSSDKMGQDGQQVSRAGRRWRSEPPIGKARTRGGFQRGLGLSDWARGCSIYIRSAGAFVEHRPKLIM